MMNKSVTLGCLVLASLLCFNNVRAGSSLALFVLSVYAVVMLRKNQEMPEEVKEEMLNSKFPETRDTFESFKHCSSKANPSRFHRCPRPYDSRYDETQDYCIYCGLGDC
jgi:hypothetical protein